MDDRDRTCCEHAVVDGDKALEYYRRSGTQWATNEMATDAIVKRIESFCEYVGNVSDQEQAQHPEFPLPAAARIQSPSARRCSAEQLQAASGSLGDQIDQARRQAAPERGDVGRPVINEVGPSVSGLPSWFTPGMVLMARMFFGLDVDAVVPIQQVRAHPERAFLFVQCDAE